MFRKILFTTDFSPLSSEALRYCASLAKKTGAVLAVVHSVRAARPFFSGSEPDPVVVDGMQRIQEQRLTSFLAISELQGLDVRPQVLPGIPEVVVNKVAAEEKADLIVVAKKSSSALEKFFIGSVTEKILRVARVPVLVFPDEGARTQEWQPVVAAVDRSSHGADVLRFAVQLTKREHELVVAHSSDSGVSPEERDAALAEYFQKVKEETQEHLSNLLTRFGGSPNTEIVLEEGKPAPTILRLAKLRGSDLLVVGSCGNFVKPGMGIGTTTNAILREAELPVIVVP